MGIRKNKSKDTREYAKRFKAWDKGVSEGGKPVKRETLYSQDYGDKTGFTPKDDEIFVQCYTTNKMAKFYKVRHCLPKYWFISQYGNLISFRSDDGNYIKPFPTGKKGEQREAYKPQFINSRKEPVNLDVGLLVAISFGYEATTNAKKLLDEFGIRALQRSRKGNRYVEIHHQGKEGYLFADGSETSEETFTRRALNCTSSKLLLACNDEHDVMKLKTEKKIIATLPHVVTDEKIVTLVPYEKSHGTMHEVDDSDFMKTFTNANIYCVSDEDATALKDALAHEHVPTIDALSLSININRQQPEGQSGIIYDIPVESGKTISVVIQTLDYKR